MKFLEIGERLSTDSVRMASSMDKTPSHEKDDELCYSEDATDDDDKGDNTQKIFFKARLH